MVISYWKSVESSENYILNILLARCNVYLQHSVHVCKVVSCDIENEVVKVVVLDGQLSRDGLKPHPINFFSFFLLHPQSFPNQTI